MIVGLVVDVIGLSVGGACGFWRSLAITAVASTILFATPGGIWIAEFPVGVFVADLLTVFEN